jgi:hypothetical protein
LAAIVVERPMDEGLKEGRRRILKEECRAGLQEN